MMSLIHVLTLAICLAAAWHSPIANQARAQEEEAEPPAPVTTDNPSIPVPQLNFLVAPLTRADLEIEAAGWRDLLKTKAEEVAAAEVASAQESEREEAEAGESTDQSTAGAQTADESNDPKQALLADAYEWLTTKTHPTSSEGSTTYEVTDGTPTLMKEGGISSVDDKAGKPVGIMRHIGQRPIFAAGNSDGDFQMLEWTTAGDGPRFGMLIHHTDAEREFAYDREGHIGVLNQGLDEAEARGWVVVDMAEDWEQVWPDAE